ncbi:MAG TPA: TIGR03936 family radical SAM-associated protein, partial [Polyangia bacterium]|nr:TIGR03936 family radical SAM-associated protein [Polyangia bacterium]
SVGFHPKPDLSFGPALGLGIASLGELLDIRLVEKIAPAELLRRLSAVTMEGIDFLGAATLGDNDAALGRVIAQAEFVARLPPEADTEAALALWQAGGTLVVRREAENKIDRMIDLRKSVRQVSLLTNGQAEVRRRLDWEGGELLRFQIAVSHQGSARPSEVVTALFDGEIAGQVELARTALWAVDESRPSSPLLDPLETEDLRARPKTAAPRPTAPSQIA